MADTQKKILLLTLVHPDFLPPVYAIAQVLRDEGCNVHILTFDSYVVADINLGKDIVVESVGRHHSIGLRQRLAIRRIYKARARQLVNEKPVCIIAFCAFTFLCGLRVRRNLPLAYHALEVADFILSSLTRSPLSQLNNLLALKLAHKADLVTTPSPQRSAWLAKRCRLGFTPPTILNAPYIIAGEGAGTAELFDAIIPAELRAKKIVLYTGAVNAHLCILELVQAFCKVNDPGSALVLTGMKDNAYCNEIVDFVAAGNSADRIKLLPYVSRAEMLALQANAAIGVCLAREYDDNEESKMMAPNKVGEYLAKGLFLLGADTAYMKQFQLKGIAALAATPTTENIAAAMKEALLAVTDNGYKADVRQYVASFYCMQQQAKPLIDFVKKAGDFPVS